LLVIQNYKPLIIMNKGDLIDKIAQKAGLKKADAAAALDATLESIQDALKEGDKVTLVGFCTLTTSYRAARTGVNPSTGKPVPIAEKVTVKFKAGKLLSEAVNTPALRKALKPKKK
jgi:DNA-binding protein HU-beta